MKTALKYFFLPPGFFFTIILFSSFLEEQFVNSVFPYKNPGLSERQSAAHLLTRLTYGSRFRNIDAAVKMGLKNDFLQQLNGNSADDSLNLMLENYDAINLSNNEVSKK